MPNAKDLVRMPRRVLQLLTGGAARLDRISEDSRRGTKTAGEVLKKAESVQRTVGTLHADVSALRDELRSLRREMRDRMLQYNLQLGRLARSAGDAGAGDIRLSGRAVPVEAPATADAAWEPIGAPGSLPDPEGVQWQTLETCPACGQAARTVVCPWNKFILIDKAPDPLSVRYDYAVCHGCGVLYASRRPLGDRYRFLLEHFGEVTAKRGGTAEISNRVLNPYPLSDADRQELDRLATAGVFVSEHLGLSPKQYLAPLLRDRLENSVHVDIIGSLTNPRNGRVLEVRSRAGTILDGLRRAWGASVYAMPIWESQQYLLRTVYNIETSDLIDFERFAIPFEGSFDVIVCNHMFTHVLRPREFFAELHRMLAPNGFIYLHNEPDDAEFLEGKQSMLATLNPLHVQAFDQRSLVRALAANGFEPVFARRRNLAHLCLARRMPSAVMRPMDAAERRARVERYEAAFARAVLAVDERLRPRVAAEWERAVERAVAAGVAEFDAEGRLRLVAS